jgi:predicted RNA-binding Zn-ribbon protein involved in translation (DUF1610 family)
MAWEIECAAGHKSLIPQQRIGTILECPKCGAAIASRVETATRTSEIHLVSEALLTSNAAYIQPVVQPAAGKRSARWKEPPTPIHKEVTVSAHSTIAPREKLVTHSTPETVALGRPSRENIVTAWHLGLLVAAVALFSMGPAVWEWIHLWQKQAQLQLPLWVIVSVLVGIILFAYGVYLSQLPDWSAMWIVTGALLLVSAGYAAVLATTLLGSYDTSLVTWLNFGDKLSGFRATLWCLVMLALSSASAYFVGQAAIRWRRVYCGLLKRIAAGT